MRAGSLDREITIERPVSTTDATYGTPVITWVPLVSQAGSPTIAEKFRAEIQDVMPSRSEAVSQGLVVGKKQTRCRLRWRDDIAANMRVTVHGDSDQHYSIIGGPADVDGRKSMVELFLEKVSS